MFNKYNNDIIKNNKIINYKFIPKEKYDQETEENKKKLFEIFMKEFDVYTENIFQNKIEEVETLFDNKIKYFYFVHIKRHFHYIPNDRFEIISDKKYEEEQLKFCKEVEFLESLQRSNVDSFSLSEDINANVSVSVGAGVKNNFILKKSNVDSFILGETETKEEYVDLIVDQFNKLKITKFDNENLKISNNQIEIIKSTSIESKKDRKFVYMYKVSSEDIKNEMIGTLKLNKEKISDFLLIKEEKINQIPIYWFYIKYKTPIICVLKNYYYLEYNDPTINRKNKKLSLFGKGEIIMSTL
jgi:hypothetical protein